MSLRLWLVLIANVAGLPLLAHGDTLTIREDDGNVVTVEARWVGERPGVIAIERSDGRIELIPQQQLVKREPGPDPEPITCEQMADRLKEEFGADLFRSHIVQPYVVGLVLSEPLPKTSDARVANCLKKGAEFMKKVEKAFLDFAKELKIELESPRYPLALLIFETDDDFMKFTTKETGGKGLTAGAILGYYSGLTNRLVIRMSECHSMSTPLHEAIHQQTFNRGIMKRLAPVPVWFSEGIATGFEGNSDKINGKRPLQVNKSYIGAAIRAKTVNWDHVVADDAAFRGDVLAGEAYGNAWSIHWFLVTKYRKQYVDYLKIISEKNPLETEDARTRVQDFERVFGKTIGKLQSEFPPWIESAAKKQNISLVDKVPVGHLVAQSNLAEVELTASKAGANSDVETEGRMRNLSQIRPMSFHITLETDAGTYAEWYLPSVDPQKGMTLPKQSAEKRMVKAPQKANANTFRIKVKSVVPESETGKAWRRGQLPTPVFSG